jgi:hypothetical protein
MESESESHFTLFFLRTHTLTHTPKNSVSLESESESHFTLFFLHTHSNSHFFSVRMESESESHFKLLFLHSHTLTHTFLIEGWLVKYVTGRIDPETTWSDSSYLITTNSFFAYIQLYTEQIH